MDLCISSQQGILSRIKKIDQNIRVLPGLDDFLQSDELVSNLKKIDLKQILNRDIKLNEKLILNKISNKTILITGAGGSIGSELTQQIIFYNPKKLS